MTRGEDTTLDPRTPVLVGCGQVKQRCDDPREAQEPLALMALAAERAADDAGTRDLLRSLDSIRVPHGLWRYANPAALLRQRFGCPRAQTASGPIAGSTVQRMLSHAAREIADGRRDAVLLVAAEAERTKRRAKAAGAPLDWTVQEGPPPDETFASKAAEKAFGAWERRFRPHPPQAFALFENALRAHRGEGVQAHRARIAGLWSRFSRVAAGNPYAWIREPKTPEEIATPTEVNRLVSFPYTKFLVANMVVDLGAALILCSVEAARRHGIPQHRWVFPHAATDVFETTPLAVRATLHDQAAIRAAGRRVLELAGAAPEDLAHVDLYSCFPAAVQIAAAEVGLSTERDLTVTGGLTFAGGPFNSYVMHAIATLMERLRSEPGSLGLSSGIGGYMSTHAWAVYSTAPPSGGFRYEDVTARAASDTVVWDEDYSGEVVVEAFTHLPAPNAGEDGEDDRLLAACRIDSGRRTWATTDDPALLEAMVHEEIAGRRGRVRPGGVLELR
jgi:acetyl-CoA C-acetyltransferase